MIRYLGTWKSHKNANSKSSFVTLLLFAVTLAGITVPLAYADTFDDQINSLKQENTQSQQEHAILEAEAGSLAGKIADIQSEISAIEAEISANTTKKIQIEEDIRKAEAELEVQRTLLATNIKQMYIEGDMSTLEMVASSNDLGDYMDRQQYRDSVQDRINTIMARIEELKQSLSAQKVEVEKLLADQQAMQARLSEQKAEQNRLLSLNEQQQAGVEQEIKENNVRISELKRQQAIENAKHFFGKVNYAGTGSYPWADVPFPNTMSDPWGMYKRQCVSYTAWKVASTGRHMPYWGGRGNANKWDENARAAGIAVDGSPRVGDVAISNAGTYGHAMYVEAVHDDGTITISQYNAGWDGKYSTGRRSTAGLVFLHF